MDYCLIVIEKLINPLTPVEQIMPLLRDLMDSVPHPEMKKLAQQIVDPSLDQGEKRKLMAEFKNFDHGGENNFNNVDYNELLDKFLDPNLPDHEYKPTMKALLEGDLDQERKDQVVNIINCHNHRAHPPQFILNMNHAMNKAEYFQVFSFQLGYQKLKLRR